MSLQNRYEPRSSSQLKGQNMLSEGRVRQIHTHTVTFYFLFRISWTSLATDILLWSSSHCLYRFFFLPLDTNWLRGESIFRPEPLRTPPHEPSRVDIQFEYDFKKNIDRYTTRNQDDAYALMQACYSPFKCKHCKGWFTRATQTQAQAQANRRVNYQDANANASTSADARNGKFFISLRLRLRLHFLRVNRINANASVRWKILVRERSDISCSFRQKRLWFSKINWKNKWLGLT